MGCPAGERALDDLVDVRRKTITAMEHAELFRALEKQHNATNQPQIAALFEEIAFSYELLAGKKGRGHG